jgi:hypothetical protein
MLSGHPAGWLAGTRGEGGDAAMPCERRNDHGEPAKDTRAACPVRVPMIATSAAWCCRISCHHETGHAMSKRVAMPANIKRQVNGSQWLYAVPTGSR